jgi:hypothetical protein
MSQPSQPPPQYAHPAHPAPGYQPYPAPGPVPVPGYVPAHRRRETGRLVLVVFVAVALLCAGGGTAAYVLLQRSVPGAAVTSHISLVTPRTLGGRARLTDAQIQAGLDQTVSELRQNYSGITSTVAAAYGNPAERDLVLVVGAAHVVRDPAKALGPFVAGMVQAGLKVGSLAAVDPGPLGGVAQCGDAVVSGVAAGVCAWADRGSFGVFFVYFKNGATAKAEFVATRSAVERRTLS